MPSSILMLILAGLALFSFVIIQSYIISNTLVHTHRIMLGCLIPAIVGGQVTAFLVNRQKRNSAKACAVFAIVTLIAFLIMQPYVITHIYQHWHRVLLGCLIPVVMFGHLNAYYAGHRAL